MERCTAGSEATRGAIVARSDGSPVVGESRGAGGHCRPALRSGCPRDSASGASWQKTCCAAAHSKLCRLYQSLKATTNHPVEPVVHLPSSTKLEALRCAGDRYRTVDPAGLAVRQSRSTSRRLRPGLNRHGRGDPATGFRRGLAERATRSEGAEDHSRGSSAGFPRTNSAACQDARDRRAAVRDSS